MSSRRAGQGHRLTRSMILTLTVVLIAVQCSTARTQDAAAPSVAPAAVAAPGDATAIFQKDEVDLAMDRAVAVQHIKMTAR